MQGTQAASLDTTKSPVYVSLLFCVSNFIDNFAGMPNKEPREVAFLSLCCLLCLWCELPLFSVMPILLQTMTTQ